MILLVVVYHCCMIIFQSTLRTNSCLVYWCYCLTSKYILHNMSTNIFSIFRGKIQAKMSLFQYNLNTIFIPKSQNKNHQNIIHLTILHPFIMISIKPWMKVLHSLLHQCHLGDTQKIAGKILTGEISYLVNGQNLLMNHSTSWLLESCTWSKQIKKRETIIICFHRHGYEPINPILFKGPILTQQRVVPTFRYVGNGGQIHENCRIYCLFNMHANWTI